jgi:hypothetical protein
MDADPRGSSGSRSRPRTSDLGLLALATVPALLWFLADGHLKIGLADEGFLWYGARAVRQGLVPIRDFQAYDPGRYAWTAVASFFLGESLVALRLACVVFGCAGVAAGLVAARRLSPHPLFLGCVALALTAWMGPRYKAFEPGLALLSVGAGVLLLERPSAARHVGVGILGGLAAFFGRNHGAYHLAAFGALIAWSSIGAGRSVFLSRVGSWFAGLAIGSLPHLALCAAAPGYLAAYLASFREIFEKGTNLAVPVPWPWTIPDGVQGWSRAAVLAMASFFVALPAFGALAVARGLALGRRGLAAHPVLVAAVCVGVPYAHHAFSRADEVHLAPAAGVVVLGLLALARACAGATPLRRAPIRWAWAAPVLLAGSLLATLVWTAAAIEVARRPDAFEPVVIAGRTMIVDRHDAAVLRGAQRLCEEYARPDEPVFFAPNLPALYPFTGRRSPTRPIYFIHPASAEEDRALLAELEAAGVRWAMIRDYALDGRDDLRFARAHATVAAYLLERFSLVGIAGLPPDVIVLERTGAR